MRRVCTCIQRVNIARTGTSTSRDQNKEMSLDLSNVMDENMGNPDLSSKLSN